MAGPKTVAPAAPPYAKDEKVLCFHGEMLYEAKILDSRRAPAAGQWQFKIHYKGWKNTWDDWVAQDRVLKFTEENKIRATHLQSQMKALQQKGLFKSDRKKGARANASDHGSGRGSEERNASVAAQSQRNKRSAREYELESLIVNGKAKGFASGAKQAMTYPRAQDAASEGEAGPPGTEATVAEPAAKRDKDRQPTTEALVEQPAAQRKKGARVILRLPKSPVDEGESLKVKLATESNGETTNLELASRKSHVKAAGPVFQQSEAPTVQRPVVNTTGNASYEAPTKAARTALKKHKVEPQPAVADPIKNAFGEASTTKSRAASKKRKGEPQSPVADTIEKASLTIKSRAASEKQKKASANTKVLVAVAATNKQKVEKPVEADQVRNTRSRAVTEKLQAAKPVKTAGARTTKYRVKDISHTIDVPSPDLPMIKYHEERGTITPAIVNDYQWMDFRVTIPLAGLPPRVPGLDPQIQYRSTVMKDNLQFDESCAEKGLRPVTQEGTNEKNTQESTFLGRDMVKFDLSDSIKGILVDDWENVTKNHMLISIPCAKPVKVILNDYRAHELPKRSAQGPNRKNDQADVLTEVVEGLREYFDKVLGRILLYKFERVQYLEILASITSGQGKWAGKEVSDIYGAEHLCRLLSSLPELIAHTNMDKTAIDQLRDEVAKFSTWLIKNILLYYNYYDHPGQQYINEVRRIRY